MKRIPRRLFTEEFKKEDIKLVAEQHPQLYTLVQIAASLLLISTLPQNVPLP